MDSPDSYGEFAMAWFCRQQPALHPTSISLVTIEQLEFTRDDYLSGKNPMDSDFVTENTLAAAECPR
jgi:hypothetical protein